MTLCGPGARCAIERWSDIILLLFLCQNQRDVFFSCVFCVFLIFISFDVCEATGKTGGSHIYTLQATLERLGIDSGIEAGVSSFIVAYERVRRVWWIFIVLFVFFVCYFLMSFLFHPGVFLCYFFTYISTVC